MVTSPPSENFTIGGELHPFLSLIGLCLPGLGDDCCLVIIGMEIGDVGRLRLLNRLTSNADRLLCR